MSNLSAFPYIPERAPAVPALWNDVYSVLSSNIAAVDSTLLAGHFQQLSIGSTPPSYSTTAAVTIEVNSAYSDYLYLVDSSAQKSSYIIGSRAGGLADGLNIWDASAATMIASFSKQSIRFFQNVVGPVFDVGGALANTLNAATFGTGADSKESRIQAAISAASIAGIARVYVPANMYPYSAGSVSFDTRVQMVREGGNWDHYDVFAYGAAGNGVANDTNAIQSVFSYAIWDASPTGTGVEVFFPAGRYSINTTITIVNRESFVIRGVGTKGSRWEWSGISGIPMLKMTNVGRGQFIDTAFWGQGGAPPDAAIQVHRDSGLTITSARFMSFSGVQVGQGATNNLRTGIRFTAAAGFDINNDNAKFLDCAFVSCSSAGLSFEHSQTKGHAIIACKFSTCGRAVATSLGTNPSTPQGGSFWASDCQITDSSIADFELGRPNDSIILKGINTEGANRWISTTTTTGAAWPITLIGCRFANNGLNVDGSGISFGNRGPITMIGCQYPSDQNGTVPVVRVTGNSTATGLNSFIAIGNSFLTTTPFLFDGSNNYYLSLQGNRYWDGNQDLPIPTAISIDSIKPTGSLNTLVILAAVGINQTNPAAKFTVNGPAKLGNVANQFLLMENGTQTAGLSGQFANPGARLYMGTLDRTNNFKDWMHVDEYGTLKLQSGSSLTLSLGFSSETSLGFYRSANSSMAISYGTLDLTGGGAVTSIASLTIKSGSNNACGTAVLGSNGSVNVANTYVKTGDLIFLTDQTPGGTLGNLEILGIRNSSGFTIGSTGLTDTSTVAWLIVRPG